MFTQSAVSLLSNSVSLLGFSRCFGLGKYRVFCLFFVSQRRIPPISARTAAGEYHRSDCEILRSDYRSIPQISQMLTPVKNDCMIANQLPGFSRSVFVASGCVLMVITGVIMIAYLRCRSTNVHTDFQYDFHCCFLQFDPANTEGMDRMAVQSEIVHSLAIVLFSYACLLMM